MSQKEQNTEIIERPQLSIDAEKQLLDYTGATKWKEIKKLNWTTAEVIEQMEIFARAKRKANRFDALVRLPIELKSIKYLKEMKELLSLGASINIKARLIHLEMHIKEDFDKLTKAT